VVERAGRRLGIHGRDGMALAAREQAR
jgi:hypothetical protein